MQAEMSGLVRWYKSGILVRGGFRQTHGKNINEVRAEGKDQKEEGRGQDYSF